ncbi:MAG: DUF4870 domain-containing protein [Bacillota bacterium]
METYKNTRLCSIISYITWIGWIIAFIIRDKRDRVTLQHVNQALNLNIVGILVSAGSRIGGVIGWAAGIIAIGALILTIWGIVRAVQMSDEPLPIVGNFRIIN